VSRTDALGAWSGEIAAGKAGPYLLTVVGGSYVDEVSGATVTLGSTPLLGYSDDGSGQVTFFTHALVQAAAIRIDAGDTPAEAWAAVTSRFQAAFGFDPGTTMPALDGSDAARTYLALLGGVSEFLDDNAALAALAAAEPFQLVLALAEDLADGVLDGAIDGETIAIPTGGGDVAWPALDAQGIDALVDAANTFAQATAGLTDLVLESVDLDFGDPVSGTDSATSSPAWWSTATPSPSPMCSCPEPRTPAWRWA